LAAARDSQAKAGAGVGLSDRIRKLEAQLRATQQQQREAEIATEVAETAHAMAESAAVLAEERAAAAEVRATEAANALAHARAEASHCPRAGGWAADAAPGRSLPHILTGEESNQPGEGLGGTDTSALAAAGCRSRPGSWRQQQWWCDAADTNPLSNSYGGGSYNGSSFG
jgi:hypothetical protein